MAPTIWQQPHFSGGGVMALTEAQWLYGLGQEMAEVVFWRLWVWHGCDDLLNFVFWANAKCQSFVPSYNLVVIRHVQLELSADCSIDFYCYLTQKSIWLGKFQCSGLLKIRVIAGQTMWSWTCRCCHEKWVYHVPLLAFDLFAGHCIHFSWGISQGSSFPGWRCKNHKNTRPSAKARSALLERCILSCYLQILPGLWRLSCFTCHQCQTGFWDEHDSHRTCSMLPKSIPIPSVQKCTVRLFKIG